MHKPDASGAKSRTSGEHTASGTSSNRDALYLEFTAEREGYHQLSARLADAAQAAIRAYVKVDYEAPATSDKF